MTIKTDYLGKEIELNPKVRDYRGSFDHGGELNSPELIWKLYHHLLPGDVLFDIGACTGSFALMDLVKEIDVYSFEPVMKTYIVLNDNIRLNGSRARTYNMAVSNYNGTGSLLEVPYDNVIALSIVDGKPSVTRQDTVQSEIDVVTIDQFCKDHEVFPTWIKIDVEGGELRVLQGAEETIRNHKPGIICEYSQENANQFGYNIQDLIDFLEGYEIEVLKDNLFCIYKR